MSDPIQYIALQLGIQTFGDGLLAKIGQTIDLLRDAAKERDQLRSELAALNAQQVECNCPGGAKENPAAHAPNCPRRAELAAIKAQQVECHPDDAAVDRFAEAMKAKLAKSRAKGRGGWEDKSQCSAEYLSELLRGHVEKGDPVDVANFCMMLQQRSEGIQPTKGGEV